MRNKTSKQDWLSDWLNMYYELALYPFETTQALAKMLWADHSQPQEPAYHYWLEAEKLIEEVAYFIWKMEGKQTGKETDVLINSYLSASKYMECLITLATRFSSSSPADRQILDRLLETFSPAAYLYQIRNLAQTMWRYATMWEYVDYRYHAKDQAIIPHSFWLSAEYHISMIIDGVIVSAKSLSDAIRLLIETFDNFSAEVHLNRIQIAAYYRWKKAGEPYGESLRYWLESENEVLARIQRGGRIAE